MASAEDFGPSSMALQWHVANRKRSCDFNAPIN
jgi:hypothetical protein